MILAKFRRNCDALLYWFGFHICRLLLAAFEVSSNAYAFNSAISIFINLSVTIIMTRHWTAIAENVKNDSFCLNFLLTNERSKKELFTLQVTLVFCKVRLAPLQILVSV